MGGDQNKYLKLGSSVLAYLDYNRVKEDRLQNDYLNKVIDDYVEEFKKIILEYQRGRFMQLNPKTLVTH